MLDITLENFLDTNSASSSSYFDFVEQKIEEDCPASKTDSREPASSGKDAFVVQVMDEETSEQLKLRYFNGTEFPE